MTEYAREYGTEQRQYRRYAIKVPVQYHASKEIYDGYCTDISQGGIRIRTNEMIEKAKRLVLEFTLPGYLEPILARGEVRWSAAIASYDYGISFYRIEGGGRKYLDAYLQSQEKK